MSGVGITYLWVSNEFPPFVRLEGKRGDYEVYTPERTCRNVDDEFPFFECSECGCNAVVGYGSSGDGLPNYCPNCGRRVVE